MKVGFGYDLLNGNPRLRCSARYRLSYPTSARSAGYFQFLRIDDLKTLHETIGVNVDAGGSYFSASADVKAQYAKECNMSQLVRVSVQNAFENFDDPVR